MTDQQLATTEPHRPRPPAMMTGGAVGALVPQTLEEAFRLASAMAASGMTPKDINTPEKVLVAIMAGAELGMKPFQACQSFAIVNGRPSLWGDGLMALALTNGLDVEEWIEGEGDNRVAFCKVTRPDSGKVVVRDYSVERAKTARLWGKVSSSGVPSPWVTSPDRMLQMRARSYAIRDAAADVLRGMPIREEVEDFIESHPGLMDRQDEPKGTGLLAKLETAKTLTGAAVEGFGVRNLSDEAGEAAPPPEPVKKPRKRTVANDALDAIAAAEPEIVAQVVEDHGHPLSEEELAADRAARSRSALRFYEKHGRRPTADDFDENDDPENPTPLLDSDVGADDDLLGRVVTQDDVDSQYGPTYAENLPADAEVEETAPTEPEAAQPALTVIAGPAPADTLYFLASDETFPSGRRPTWWNGNPNGSEDAGADIPVYEDHPAGAEVELSDPENAATAEPATGAEPDNATAGPPTPFDAFDEAARTATELPTLVGALRELFASPECRTPELRRGPRLKLWATVARWNDEGAKIDPVSDPFVLAAYIEATDDIEAIEATLPLAREQAWFAEGGEAMQAGVGRAVADRVKTLKGA